MSRSTAIAIVFVAIIGVGAVLIAREFRTAEARPAVQRLEHRRALAQLAQALRDYQDDCHAWPDNLFHLLRHERLPIGAAHGYSYRAPTAGAGDDAVVVASEAYHPAVKRGEPYGAEGERAKDDVPAAAYVVTKALRVEELPLDEARRRSWLPPTVPVR